MQPATRRVKSIYSVIASSNRLEILRILNTKGPLSYSELKALAGFRSKKESGKFAYHLRKLVKQMLISLNRSERRYTVTNLGRLVLNLTRQIEEQSVIESGKLYVRTSRHTMEEFNADKILQSLVREAGMPVELAQKITSETEARLYKFQTNYLTAPLIREMVNALLIEHGYEEYRHRLTRLGLPVYDVTELLNKAGGLQANVQTVMAQTAHSVFSEYLLLAQLPKDVADAHLAGDIHISNIGTWGLMPDTIFADLLPIHVEGIRFNGISTPLKISAPTNLEEAIAAFLTLSSHIGDEASSEIIFRNVLPYFAKFVSKGMEHELKRSFLTLFMTLPLGLKHFYTTSFISIQLAKPGDEVEGLDDSILDLVEDCMLEAYADYVSNIPCPLTKLITSPHQESRDIHKISQIVRRGGCIAVNADPKLVYSYSGLKKILPEGSVILHSLSLNLPRLAYESNQDETYFRAKLAMLLQLTINSLLTRRSIVTDIIRRGLLPILAKNPSLAPSESIPLTVNLTGLYEAVSNLIGEKASASIRRSVTSKVIETAVKVTSEQCGRAGASGGVAIIDDDSGSRFRSLDEEKYGRSVSLSREDSYTQTPTIQYSDLSNQEFWDENSYYSNILNSGYSATLALSDDGGEKEVLDAIEEGLRHNIFFRLRQNISVCRNCGSKFPGSINRCKQCSSTSIRMYKTC